MKRSIAVLLLGLLAACATAPKRAAFGGVAFDQAAFSDELADMTDGGP